MNNSKNGTHNGQRQRLRTCLILRHSRFILTLAAWVWGCLAGQVAGAQSWGTVATSGTLTSGYLCGTDGTDIICDASQPFNSSGKLGLGTQTPVTLLDVAGSLRLADGGEDCDDVAKAGMLKYSGGAVFYCEGSSWQQLAAGSSVVSSFLGLSDTPSLANYTGLAGQNVRVNGAEDGLEFYTLTLDSISNVSAGGATDGQILQYDADTTTWQAVDAATVVSTVAGADTQVQFNNAGSLAGAADLVYDTANARVGIGQPTPAEKLHVGGNIRLSGMLKLDGEAGGVGDSVTITEVDPKVGTLTAGNWCTSDGNVVNCTSSAPSGSLAGLSDVSAGGATDGQILQYDADATTWQAVDATTVVSTVAGADTQVQFNNAGSLAGAADLVYDTANARVGIGQPTPAEKLHVGGNIRLSGMVKLDGEAGGVGTSASLSEVDPKVGTLTAGNWCTSDGNVVNCTSSAPSGSLAGLSDVSAGGATDGQILQYDADATTWQAVDATTVVSTVAGADTQVQFNNAGSLAGAADLVYDTANARVGIGQATPAEKLHVGGNIRLSGMLKLDGEAGGAGNTAALVESDPKVGTLTNGSWCTSNGSVVNCTSSAPAAGVAGSDTQLQYNDNGSLAGAPELVFSKTNGYVGIGPALTPAVTLHLARNSSMGGISGLNANLDKAILRIDEPVAKLYVDGNTVASDASLQLGTLGAYSTQFFINDTLRMTLDTDGDLGIGQATPAEKLHVAGNIRLSGMVKLDGTTGGTGTSVTLTETDPTIGTQTADGWCRSTGSLINCTAAEPTVSKLVNSSAADRVVTDTYVHIKANTGIGLAGNPTVPLEVNGTVKASAFDNSSDRALKTDIATIQSALEKITALRGVTFHWDTAHHPNRAFPAGEQLGVIAQEVETVFPQVVHGTDGDKAVNYAALVAPLIEAVKELNQQLTALQQENAALTQRVQTLEQRP